MHYTYQGDCLFLKSSCLLTMSDNLTFVPCAVSAILMRLNEMINRTPLTGKKNFLLQEDCSHMIYK